MRDARQAFADLVRARGDSLDLARAALWIAAEEYPELEVETYVSRLDTLATAARASLGGAESATARVQQLNHFLFEVERFQGNQDAYYDPRNSFLNEVIDRRTGIPITLALIYVEVARRLGLRAFGVSFPGHFLVKCTDGEDTIVDPFYGRVLETPDLEARLRTALGPDARLEPAHLRVASSEETLIRMLRNLKLVYLQQEDLERALACCDRILLVSPDRPQDLRERACIYERLECFGAAVADFERFLVLAPHDAAAAEVRRDLPGLRARTRALH